MSEIAQIQFDGVANEPSDHMHKDGELSVSENAVLHNGSVRPVLDGDKVYTFVEGWKLLLIHEYDDIHNYIFEKEDGSLCFAKHGDSEIVDQNIVESNTTLINTDDDGAVVSLTVRKVVNVRLVLCISTDEYGIVYARWDGDKYKYLGQLPELPYIYPFIDTEFLQFTDIVSDFNGLASTTLEKAGTLTTKIIVGDEYDFNDDTHTNDDDYNTGQKIREEAYAAYFAMINPARKKIQRDGKFSYPFYVRFAYRMYDGTCVSVTRPHLMYPTSAGNPYLLGLLKKNSDGSYEGDEYRVNLAMSRSTLHAYIGKMPEGWEDIITGVDVYVSADLINFSDSKDSLVSAAPFKTVNYETISDDYSVDEGSDDPMTRGIYQTISIDLDKDDEAGYAYDKSETKDLTLAAIEESMTIQYEWVKNITLHHTDAGNYDKWNHGSYYVIYAIPKTINPTTGELEDSGYFEHRGRGHDNAYIVEGGNDWNNIILAAGIDETTAKQYSWKKFVYEHLKYNWYAYNTGADSITMRKFKFYIKKDSDNWAPAFYIKTSRTDGKDYADVIKDNGTFYKVSHIDFNDIDITRIVTPEIGKYELENIVTKETLKDGEVDGYEYTVRDILQYNNRLTAVVERMTFDMPDYFESFCSSYTSSDVEHETDETGYTAKDIYFKVKRDGQSYVMKAPHIIEGSTYDVNGIRYLYYNNINAVSAYISCDGRTEVSTKKFVTGSMQTSEVKEEDRKTFRVYHELSVREVYDGVKEVKLTQHANLMGSYWFNNFNPVSDDANEWGYTSTFTAPEGTDLKFEKLVPEQIVKVPVNSESADTVDETSTSEETSSTDTTEQTGTTNDTIYKWVIIAEHWEEVDDPETELGTQAYTRGITTGLASIYKQMSDFYEVDVTESKEYSSIKKTDQTAMTLEELEAACQNNTFDASNKIYQTLVDNPFAFQKSLACDINCDVIYKLSTITKPISVGQFGDFPLYAFTDNGIWALSVSTTGTYSSISPVSEDVCPYTDSVTQLDQSILFATDRGLMELTGGDVACLSEILSGHNFIDGISKLSDVATLANMEGVVNVPAHIEDFIKSCRILYNYKRQLIYFFSKDDKTAYVYSLNSKAWGMMVNDSMSYPCGSYTDALVVKEGNATVGGETVNTLVNMSEFTAYETTSRDSLIVTRPLMFGLPDSYKTIEDIILRGVFDTDSMKMVIWASNDLKNWWVIGSSATYKWRNYSGTPYKAYRLGVIANWKERDSLTGADIIYTPRANNKIR